MGTKFKLMFEEVKKDYTLENFHGKKIAVDAFNTIYQFLSTIKGFDGKPLKNFSGVITSHISGLLYRNINFFERDIKPIFCFDGLEKSRKLRWNIKPNSEKVRINKQIIEESKKLLEYMGIPCIQGLAEGEAQCCLLTQLDQAFCVASQDYDCLTFGAKRFAKNFSVSRTKKKGDTKIKMKIEFVTLEKFMDHHGLTRDSLIDMSILIGNDFYPGVKGIGEKTAIKIFKDYDRIEDIERDFVKELDFDEIEKVRKIFKNPKVNTNYRIQHKKPNYDKLHEFLVEENNFSKERIESIIEKLRKMNSNRKQINLESFMR